MLRYPFTVKWILPAFDGNNDPLDIETVTPLATPAVLLMMLCAVPGSLPAIALANAVNCDAPQFHAAVPVAAHVIVAPVDEGLRFPTHCSPEPVR